MGLQSAAVTATCQLPILPSARSTAVVGPPSASPVSGSLCTTAIGNSMEKPPPHRRDLPRRVGDEVLKRPIAAGVVHARQHAAHGLQWTVAE
jgi:hypothetical protein